MVRRLLRSPALHFLCIGACLVALERRFTTSSGAPALSDDELLYQSALALGADTRDPAVRELLAAPGNPGIAALARCLPIPADDLSGLVAAAEREAVDLVVVGPEAPLVSGLADRLRAAGIATFGPSAAAARLEGSKAFAKDFMRAHGIPTAEAETFVDPAAAAVVLGVVPLALLGQFHRLR